jgi:hypothetical protein
MPSVILVSRSGQEFSVSKPESFVDAVYSRGAHPKTGTVAANYQTLTAGGPAPTESANQHVTLGDLTSSGPARDALRAAFVPRPEASPAVRDAVAAGVLLEDATDASRWTTAGGTGTATIANGALAIASSGQAAYTVNRVVPWSLPKGGAIVVDLVSDANLSSYSVFLNCGPYSSPLRKGGGRFADGEPRPHPGYPAPGAESQHPGHAEGGHGHHAPHPRHPGRRVADPSAGLLAL